MQYSDKTKDQLIEEINELLERNRILEKREKGYKAEKDELEKTEKEASRKQDEINGLLKCARAVLRSSSFEKTAREIFDVCCELTGARSGYVAFLNELGQENEVLFLESGGLDCTVDPELPMPIRGLRSEAYKDCKSVFDNDFMKSEWVRFMPEGHVALANVLFAPLAIEGKAVGLMGLANKKTTGFTEKDAALAAAFGELASIALQNSRNLDQLREALAKIKTLHGLIPICASCKKIRDDKGYWNSVESYIRERSEAEFTHGICPECSEKLYPGLIKKK